MNKFDNGVRVINGNIREYEAWNNYYVTRYEITKSTETALENIKKELKNDIDKLKKQKELLNKIISADVD